MKLLLQLNNFWSKHKIDNNADSFIDTEVKFGFIVAESHSHHYKSYFFA